MDLIINQTSKKIDFQPLKEKKQSINFKGLDEKVETKEQDFLEKLNTVKNKISEKKYDDKKENESAENYFPEVVYFKLDESEKLHDEPIDFLGKEIHFEEEGLLEEVFFKSDSIVDEEGIFYGFENQNKIQIDLNEIGGEQEDLKQVELGFEKFESIELEKSFKYYKSEDDTKIKKDSGDNIGLNKSNFEGFKNIEKTTSDLDFKVNLKSGSEDNLEGEEIDIEVDSYENKISKNLSKKRADNLDSTDNDLVKIEGSEITNTSIRSIVEMNNFSEFYQIDSMQKDSVSDGNMGIKIDNSYKVTDIKSIEDLSPLISRQVELMSQYGKNSANIEVLLQSGEELNIYINFHGGRLKTKFTGESLEIKEVIESGWGIFKSEMSLKGIDVETPTYSYKDKNKEEKSAKQFQGFDDNKRNSNKK